MQQHARLIEIYCICIITQSLALPANLRSNALGKDAQFYVTLREAGNRDALAVSEGYRAKADALRMITLVRAGVADGEIDD